VETLLHPGPSVGRVDTNASTARAIVVVRGKEVHQLLKAFGLRDAVRLSDEKERTLGLARTEVV